MSPTLYESLHIWNTESTPDNVSRNGARHTLRTVWFRGHGRRSARHVATNPLRFCSFAKTTSSSANGKKREKTLEICCKTGPVEKRQPRDVATFTARLCQN